jgi:hypothetical protein
MKERTVIVAVPGWHLAILVEPEPEKSFLGAIVLEPMIAWEIEREEMQYRDPPNDVFAIHRVLPLTASGSTDDQGNKWALKAPDGTFDIPYDATFSSEQDLLAYWTKK